MSGPNGVAEAPPFERELEITMTSLAAVDAQRHVIEDRRRELEASDKALAQELSGLTIARIKLVARLETLRELRGEAPALQGPGVPVVSEGEPVPEPAIDAGPDGDDPAPA